MDGDLANQQVNINAQISLVDIVNKSYELDAPKGDVIEGEFTEKEVAEEFIDEQS